MRIALALAAWTAIVVPGAALSAGTTEHGYVTTTLAVPHTNTERNAYARDIDGDGDRDNHLGGAFATLASMGFDFQHYQDDAIARGDLLMLHALRTRSLANTKDASWQVLYAQSNPDPDFSGSGSFSVDGTAPHSARLPAKITRHRVKTAAGTIPLRIALPGGSIYTLKLKKAKVFATCSPTDCSSGRLNGAVTAEQLDTAFIPALVESFTPIVARDCPSDHCQDNSEGKTLVNLFDVNHDYQITTQEVRENSLIEDFLAPDLDLVKANGRPGHDGVDDAVSFGVGFEAVQAQLARP